MSSMSFRPAGRLLNWSISAERLKAVRCSQSDGLWEISLSASRGHTEKIPHCELNQFLHSVSSKEPELRPDGLNFWLYTRCSRSVQIKAPGHSSLLTPNNQLVNEQVSCCLICALKQSIICPYCCYYHLYYFVINIIIIVLLLLLSTSCCVC